MLQPSNAMPALQHSNQPSLLQQLTLFYTMVAHIPQPTLQLQGGQGPPPNCKVGNH